MSKPVVDIDAVIAARNGSGNNADQSANKSGSDNDQGNNASADDGAVAAGDDSTVDDDKSGANDDKGSGSGDDNGKAGDSAADSVSDDANKNVDASGSTDNDNPSTNDEELDLDSYSLEIDGSSRTLNSLLDEREALLTEKAELTKRVEKIEGNEFLKRFIDHYEATGDASAFLESQAVKWDKKDDLSVIRANFEKENSDIPEATRELMFQEELKNKYKIDPNASPEDVDKESAAYKIGQALLKRDAEKYRAAFVEEQKKFAIPEKPKAAEPVDYKKQQAEYKKALDEKLADFKTKKLLKVDVGAEDGTQFGFEVENPDDTIEMMTDDRKFWNLFRNDKGVVDFEKLAKVFEFARNPASFEQQLVEFGKTLAVEKTLKEKRNTDGGLKKGSKDGVEGDGTGGDWKKGFLKAAQQQKKR